MIRSVQTIENDLAALENILQRLAQDLYSTYQDYLAELGQSARRQFILASYHLCTQGFPEAFLRLSFQERQNLQGDIRALGQEVQQRLTDLIKRPFPSGLGSNADSSGTATVHDAEPLPPLAPLEPELLDLGVNQPSNGIAETGIAETAIAPEAPTHPMTQPLTPRTLAHWQDSIEDAIVETLQDISHAANRCFQDADILSDVLPDALIEIASKADMIAESSGPAPNLLKLRLETESKSADGEMPSAQITVIHMRLSEIEFANPELMPRRTKIRDLSTRLTQLHHEYRRKHHEKAIAEAESAWRSSWVED